ncbi:hypothetical protein [Burkholderia ubonensis]|nr:hypothetical protein [Burkholderia ubonensis]
MDKEIVKRGDDGGRNVGGVVTRAKLSTAFDYLFKELQPIGFF